MRRFWTIGATLGVVLCALAAAGCEERRERDVTVIRERPQREVIVEHERRAEPERHGDEHDRDMDREREHRGDEHERDREHEREHH